MGGCRYGMVNTLVEIASILCSISHSNPRGAAHACSGNSFRGGVSPRFTRRPKGQSTVEYVLIIAVIGLVILIAGPWVSSAIRNQFNLVSGAIGSGTTGENFYDPEDIPDPENGTAFAVYSEDDRSLMFYKRRGVPSVGDMFNCRRVTAVYTGFEDDVYLADESSSYNGATNTPWYEARDSIAAIDIVDDGIKPKSMAFWFQHLSELETVTGLSKLDTSQATSFQHTFAYTESLQSVDVSSLDTSASRSFDACFTHSGITDIDLSSWNVENSNSMGWIFTGCYSLKAVKMPHSGTGDGLGLSSAFAAATSLQSVDMSGFRPSRLRSISDLFSDCWNLVEVKGIEGWDTSKCASFDRSFRSCALQELDISSWTMPADATSENMLDNMSSIKSVSVGAGFELNRCALPAQSFTGADGKWYSVTTGKGYAPADIPSGRADTYVASRDLLAR